MVGQIASPGNLPVAECRRIVVINGCRIRRLGIPGPVIVHQIHGLDLVLRLEQFRKDTEDILLDILVDNHLPHLNLTLEIIVGHLQIAQGTKRNVVISAVGFAVNPVIQVIALLDLPAHEIPAEIVEINLFRLKNCPGRQSA